MNVMKFLWHVNIKLSQKRLKKIKIFIGAGHSMSGSFFGLKSRALSKVISKYHFGGAFLRKNRTFHVRVKQCMRDYY